MQKYNNNKNKPMFSRFLMTSGLEQKFRIQLMQQTQQGNIL